MSAKGLLRACWLLPLLAALAACGSKPPKPVIMKVGMEANASVNPDVRNRPSPVVVRVFELKSVTAFNRADFFTLYEKESEALGADLVAREEVLLKPGDKQSLERQWQPDTKYIGVLAAFRNLDKAQWRSTVAIAPPKKKQTLIVPVVSVAGNSVTVKVQE